MAETMSREPLDAIIRRLVGGEADASDRPLTAEERRALAAAFAQRADAARSEAGADRDAADEHLRLAAYLDGTMAADEKERFERELAASAAQRDALTSAAAWSDALDAGRRSASEDLLRRAMALDATPSLPAGWWRTAIQGLGPSGSRRPWTLAASAAACLLVAVIGFVVVHQNLMGPGTQPPTVIAVPQPSAPPTVSSASDKGRAGASTQRLEPTPALAAALSRYDEEPSADRREAILAALRQAKSSSLDTARVVAITIDKRLYDRLQQPDGPLPMIAVTLSADGRMTFALAE
jgi:hypothetical protein